MADYRVPITQAQFDVVFNARTSGIAASIEYQLVDNEGAVVVGPTGGLTEVGTTGVYTGQIATPGTEGEWSIIFSKDGSFDPTTNAVDYLVTFDPGTAVPDVPPLTPISADGITGVGPCQAWTSEDRVAECCAIDSADDLEGPVVAASQILYELSNRRFPGTCTTRVRPCGNRMCAGPWENWQGWGWIPTRRDLGVYGTWGGSSGLVSAGCGCAPLDRIPLAGKAREILEVTIDGQIVDPSTYRLDERRWLTRVPDPASPTVRLSWPGCQDMESPETEDGTFSILYSYGDDPPVIGQYAAEELACAIHQTCPGGAPAGSDADCDLPTNVVKVVRNGVTIERDTFVAWAYDKTNGRWRTGFTNVDLFLNTYAPNGRQRRGRVWSPDTRRFPRPVAGAS